MQPSWAAEQIVSPELAAALVEDQFPQLAPARATLLGAGFDNTAYGVNGDFVFRFPRRQIAADLMEVEIGVLPHVAALLPLPISAPTFIGKAESRYRWSFAGYCRLPGETACRADLDDERRCAAAEPLACFLKSLHAIDATQAASWGAPPDTIGRLDMARRIPQAREHLTKLHERGILNDSTPWAGLIEDAAGLRTPRADTLVHGDLYARHLLFDANGALCGVIDWGDVHVGDAAIDLAIAFSFLPGRAWPVFQAAYGPIDSDTRRLARFRALQHALLTAWYASEIADEALLRESLASLKRVAAAAG